MTTKEKLIKSALELFQKKGFENTSTALIAKNAGVATGTLFVHFMSKNELLDDIYISIKKESHAYVFSNIGNDLTTGEKLKVVYTKTFEYYIKNYEKLIFIEQFTNSPHIHRIDMNRIGDEMEEYLKILDAAKKEGIVGDKSNELLSATIGGLFFSLSKYIKNSGEKTIKTCVTVIMNALK